MREVEIENEKILFECMHIDDLEAYGMMKKNIEITPLNAPLSTHKLAIIANGQSPYGFSSISDNNGNWEYMGLGHSGACSLVTNLLKQLQYWKHQAELGSETCDRQDKEIQELQTQNEALKNCDKTLIYIKARDNFEKLKKIKEISKGCCNNCDYAEKNNPDCECTNSKLNTIFEIIEE